MILNQRIIILKLLSKNPKHGYQLSKDVGNEFGYEPSMGSLHPTLNKMEDEGLIMSAGSVEQGRYKKIYSITSKGRDELDKSASTVLKFLKD